MYEELRSPFSVRWAREAGFGAKSLMRLQRAGLMVEARGKLRLLDVPEQLVATTAVGPPVGLGHRSAADWYGWPMLTVPSQIELIVPGSRCPTPWPGARIIRSQLDGADIVRVRGVPVTRPRRTAADLALNLPPPEALAVLDAACRQGALSRRDVQALRGLGRPKASLMAELVNPDRASVYESLFYFLISRTKLPTPRCQFEVRKGRVFIARVDFAWVDLRLVVEIDGFQYHSDRAAFERDRRRQNALVNARWRVLRFTAADLLLRPDEVVAEVRMALRRPAMKINASMILD